jgi:hypothetical protein
MKRFSILLLSAGFSAISFYANAQNKNTTQVKDGSQEQPYKIANTNIRLGNMAYSQKVLRAWKDYDNNTLDNSVDIIAENIMATFPDGTVIKGRDNFMKFLKDYRNSLAAVSSTVDACTTLTSPDHPEREVVTIWGVETGTNKDGTVTKTHLNEVWFFNKDGKVTEFHQLAAKGSPENK